jgi:hypothetical protein
MEHTPNRVSGKSNGKDMLHLHFQLRSGTLMPESGRFFTHAPTREFTQLNT